MVDVHCPTCEAPAVITGLAADGKLNYVYEPPKPASGDTWWKDKTFWAAALAVAATIGGNINIDRKVEKKAESLTEKVDTASAEANDAAVKAGRAVAASEESHRIVRETREDTKSIKEKVNAKSRNP